MHLVIFIGGKKGWTTLLLFVIHFVDDGGGVYVEPQSRAKFKEPFGYDVQFIKGEINFDGLGVIILVVLVVL